MRDGEKFRLGDLCSITKGETPIKQAIPGFYPLVVTAAERASHESFQFDCRAVIVPLVSSTGHGHASIKRINYQEGKFALGSILCAVMPKDEKRLSAKFLHVYFSYFKDQLIVPLMKGSANVSLSVGALAELKIIVPPMEIQQRVIRLAENDALMKPLEHEITHQKPCCPS
ncbi:MAG: restriction endonuclease subunit S [Thiobacillus sp.]